MPWQGIDPHRGPVTPFHATGAEDYGITKAGCNSFELRSITQTDYMDELVLRILHANGNHVARLERPLG